MGAQPATPPDARRRVPVRLCDIPLDERLKAARRAWWRVVLPARRVGAARVRYRVDSETVTYLGYRIVVREHDLEIREPNGRLLARECWELSTARAFIRGCRREDRKAAA